MQKERMIFNLSDFHKEALRSIIGFTLKRFILGSKLLITSDKKQNLFYCNEICITLENNDFLKVVFLIPTYGSRESLGIFPFFNMKTLELKKLKAGFYDDNFILGNLLLRNRSLFSYNDEHDCMITSIDVYGQKLDKYSFNYDDFPEDVVLVTSDIDMLFKFNTDKDFFFVSKAYEENTTLMFYDDPLEFEKFIKITQENWGVLHAIHYKFTIK